MKTLRMAHDQESQDNAGVMEWLVSGNASARLLDFFVTFKNFDYSETDIAEAAGVSVRTAIREIPKFESVKLIKFTRHVGRAKMYRLNENSEAARYLEKFVYEIATQRVNDAISNAPTLQEKLPEDAEPIINSPM